MRNSGQNKYTVNNAASTAKPQAMTMWFPKRKFDAIEIQKPKKENPARARRVFSHFPMLDSTIQGEPSNPIAICWDD
jgi:hypothetical protein